MSARSFFRGSRQVTVGEIVKLAGAELRGNADPARPITGIATLVHGGPSDLVFLDHAKFADEARASAAGACLTDRKLAGRVSSGAAVLIVADPFQAFVDVARALYPEALRPSSLFSGAGAVPGIAAGAVMHPSARVESGVIVDPGAVVGAGAEIGAGTIIGANAVIGANVRIGRNCAIGPNASVGHALIGDRVTVHAGCQIGQESLGDGFGFASGAPGHRKIPQVGRVIIQDDVEIGADASINRGGLGDTVIGEGTKIDNQVQVGHNVVIGRHCVLVAQVGIAGSVVLEDYVMLERQVGVAEQVTIGEGAKVAALSAVMSNIPAKQSWAGSPAKRSGARARGRSR